MRHGATFAQALAGAACTVLLASCATQGTASPAVQDEPAGQAQVVYRAEEADEKDEGPEAEKDEEPGAEQEPEPEPEAEPAEDAFDASAPVVDATSELGVDVTAPEGFLDTPEFSAVEQEIVALENAGYSVSVRMVDLETGRGVSYNADEVRYPASSIKAAYCAMICETNGGSAGMGATMADCLLNSSNEAYTSLIETFRLAPFAQWLTKAGAPDAGSRAHDHYYPDISANELAAVWEGIWRYGTSGEAGASELTSYLSQTGYTPIGELLREKCEVWSKAGWYPADENSLTSTNDAGVVFSDSGTYVLVVMTDLSAYLDGISPLISALDAAHDVMCGA